MISEIEQRVLTLLRNDPEPLVPLTRIHAALVAELGPRTGTYAQLHERLRRRPDLFLLLEPLPMPWSADAWAADIEDEYRHALREAGLDPGPHVALATPDAELPPLPATAPPAAPVLRSLQESLVHLWSCAADDPELQAELVEALGQAEEIRRALEDLAASEPLEPPPGPPPQASR